MSLRLVYGHFGSGKTSFCIHEALSQNESCLYIAPQQFTFTAEQRFCNTVNIHGLGGVQIVSFQRLAARVLSLQKGGALPRLDSRMKAIIMQKLLIENKKKLRVFKKAENDTCLAGELCTLFGELKRYSISPDVLRMAAESLPHCGDKFSDIALLLEKYEETVSGKYADRDDDIELLSTAILTTDFVKDKEIFIDRFDGFDPGEIACIRSMLAVAKRVTVTVALLPEDKNKSEFMLHARMADKLTEIAHEINVPIEKSVILGERKIDNQELAFLEKSYFTYPTSLYENKTESIKLLTSINPMEEVHHAARMILKLCREKGYRFRDIAVCARNIDMYEEFLSSAFACYDIPFFMDRRISILQHPFVVFVLSALELILKGFSYDVMFRYIKSGFLRIRQEDADTLENYVLATGIRGNIWKSEENWKARVRLYGEEESEVDKETLRIADMTRRKIMAPLLKLESDLRNGKSAADKCVAIYAFLTAMKAERRIRAIAKLFEKNGDLGSAAEYRGVYNDLVDALDGIYDTFGDEEISLRRLYDMLRVGLGDFETGIIPSSSDSVSVGSIDRVKGYNVKAVFAFGVADGVFPASPERGGILPDADRIALSSLGVDIATMENKTILEEEHLIYKCITMPTEFLCLSYAAADMEGNAMRPSRIYNRVREIFPAVCEVSELTGIAAEEKISVPDITMRHVLSALRNGEADEKMRRAMGWLLEHRQDEMEAALSSLMDRETDIYLKPDTVNALYGQRFKTSVTRLEKQASCPFAFYTSYVLGAKERKIMQPAATDAGRFLHDFIDMFSKRLRENHINWRSVDSAYIDKEFEIIAPLLEGRISKFALENSPRLAYLFTRLRASVRASILMLSEHMRASSFEPLGYELKFDENGDFLPLTIPLPEGKSIQLTGRIDRADALYSAEKNQTLLRIIDYKSGTPSFDLGDISAGLQLQLAVYISALCTKENETFVGKNPTAAGMLYFKIDDPIVDALPSEQNEVIDSLHKKKFKLSGLVLSDEDVIRAMDLKISTSSDVLPARLSKGIPSGNVATQKQFAAITETAIHTAKRLSQEILNGNVSIRPYQKEDKTPCAYCQYRSICTHDGKTFRQIEKKMPSEVWAEMEAADGR